MDVSQQVLDIARTYLSRVRRSGSENVMATCPFHGGGAERHPSLAMSLTTGVFFCHACHEKGSLFTFLRKVGLDRATIDVRYGLTLEEVRANAPRMPDATRPSNVWVPPDQALPHALLGLFDYDVTGLLPEFSQNTLRHFDVGFDKWFNRLTFPIFDMEGALVAISGRATLTSQSPRYKIYDDEYQVWDMPARHGWNKRAVLWNSHRVYPEVLFGRPDSKFVIVVEGFKQAMRMHEAGIDNVVALLGSYLSWEQEWMLVRLGVPVYLFLDNDRAGWRGQLNAASRLSTTLETRIVQYPTRLQDDDDAQPDSLTLEEVLWQKASAPTYAEWLMKPR